MDVEFCQIFFLYYWDNYLIFILQYVNVVYHNDWFMYVKPCLHPWNECHFLIVCDPTKQLLNFVCEYFIDDFYVYVHQAYMPMFFFFFNLCIVLLLGKDGLVKWVWKCSFLISCFGKNNWRRMNINSFFNVWQNSLWSHLDLDFCLRRVLWLLVQVCY